MHKGAGNGTCQLEEAFVGGGSSIELVWPAERVEIRKLRNQELDREFGIRRADFYDGRKKGFLETILGILGGVGNVLKMLKRGDIRSRGE